jgi:hypothetical protein
VAKTSELAAKALDQACQNAAHALGTLADDDEALAALLKIDGGKELVDEIRDVNRLWNEAGQTFLGSLSKEASDQLVCRECGSAESLQIMLWVNALTGEVDQGEPCFSTYSDPKTAGVQSQYCKACKADHGAVLKSEWKKVTA